MPPGAPSMVRGRSVRSSSRGDATTCGVSGDLDRTELARDGAFARRASVFRDWVDEGEPGRYHLYVAAACPWCHRTMIVRELMGLGEAVGISYLDPIRDARGWAFTGGGFA